MTHSHGQVFVVDDDPGFLSAVSRLIRARGFDVESFTDLPGLYARLPLPAKSCVLSDIVLRRESGLEVGKALNALGEPTPVVFMSATDDPARIAAANMIGAVPCLRKPFEAEDLFKALDAALQAQSETIFNNEEEER